MDSQNVLDRLPVLGVQINLFQAVDQPVDPLTSEGTKLDFT